MLKPWLFLIAILSYSPLYSTPLEEARSCFDATLYEAAIEKYKPLLKSATLSKKELEEVQDHLAQAYLYEQAPTAALEVLAEFPFPLEGAYLQGVAWKSLGNLPEAAQAFANGASSPNERQQEAFLELGLTLFELQAEVEVVRKPLEEVKFAVGKEALYHQAQIALARLDLRAENWDKAIKRMRNLQISLPSGDLYNIQAAFWMGVAFYQKGNYPEALQAFAASLPKKGNPISPWQGETLRYMVDCTLQLAQGSGSSQGNPSYFNQAEELLRAAEPTEEGELALAELLLFKGKQFNDPATFQKGRELIEDPKKFKTLPLRGKVCAVLAQVTDGDEREKYVLEMTTEPYMGSPFYTLGWLTKGQDFLRQGDALRKKDPAAAAEFMQRAADAFEKSGPVGRTFQAEALYRLKTEISLKKALHLLDQEKPSAEVFYRKGLIHAELDLEKGITVLKEGLTEVEGEKGEKLQLLLATLYFKNHDREKAFEQLSALSEKTADPEIASQALLWAARCVEDDKGEEAKRIRQKIVQEYPQTTAAAEGYFFLYPYRDYVQGDRIALKHLQAFKDKFPQSPLGVVSHYLVGLDFKRDRRTVEGKWIRKKDLNSSIEAFQCGETLFEELDSKQLIPEGEYSFYLKVKQRSTLERALSNLTIADESQGAKRQIFLEYAEEVFRNLGESCQGNDPGYPPLLEESSYWLAQVLLKQGQKAEAKKQLQEMLSQYQKAKVGRGYFLSRVWYDLGQLALGESLPQNALEYFSFAEDAAKGKILSTDQRIDLLIQKSLCYQALNETDTAMLLLSQAINSDEVSALRIKAMYLRAEIYLQQGRKELARKQLEATSKKGGEWGQKAKQKLEEIL